jgi:hypothetical protein
MGVEDIPRQGFLDFLGFAADEPLPLVPSVFSFSLS